MSSPMDASLNRVKGRMDEYDSLPESLKLIHTRQQWLWLGEERNRAVSRETEPDQDVIE